MNNQPTNSISFSSHNILKVASINIRSTSIATPQNLSNSQRSRRLSRKRRPRARRTSPGIAKLVKRDIRRVRRTGAPLRPPRRIDDVRHAGVLDRDARVRLPGPPEVVRPARHGRAAARRDAAVVEDVPAAGAGARAPGRGHVA